MRHLIIYFFILTLVGCNSSKDPELALLPREYYRPLLSEKDIGVAFSKSQESLDDLIPLIVQHEKISEAIYLSHEGETLIGVRLMPYHRLAGNDVIEEISSLTAIEVTNIIHDPRKYRTMEKLSKEKQLRGVNNNWVNEWSTLKGITIQ
ncbi:hypothetical protein [Bacillus sp. AK128]